MKDDVVGVQAFAEGQVFHDLGYRADTVEGCVVEDVQRDLSVDKQGRGGAVVAGERHVSVHVLKPIQVEVGYTLIRRQTNWVAAVRRLANREWNRQTPKDLPRTAAMKAAIADAKEPAKKQKLLHHSPGRQTRVAMWTTAEL